MLVRRLPSLALLAGLPLLLAHCSSDTNSGGGSAGTPSSAGTGAGGSVGVAGQASAGAPAGGSVAVAGGGSTGVAGSGVAGAAAGSAAGGASAGSGGASGGSGGGSSAGAANGGSAGKAGGGSGGSTSGSFTLSSTEIVDGMTIPEAHTCDGKGGFMDWGVAPSFKWSNPPAGTMSYAFFMIDWTLTMGASPSVNGYHSGAWNIPTTLTQLSKGWAAADLGTSAKSINGGYLGPCPPSGTDTYHMIIMALPMASYTITGSGTAGVKTAYDMLKGVALASAELTGTYKKK